MVTTKPLWSLNRIPPVSLPPKDQYGQTNLERAENRLAPLDENGSPYQLHHVQQRDQGQLAELTAGEHQGKKNDEILHDNRGPSEIDRKNFDQEIRGDHWQARAEQVRAERMMDEMDAGSRR